MDEHWKDIIGYEGIYQVSNLGRVKTLPHKVRTKWSPRLEPGKILVPNKVQGYLSVKLSKGGGFVPFLVVIEKCAN